LRQRLLLEEYGAGLEYVQGSNNVVADALSRLPTDAETTNTESAEINALVSDNVAESENERTATAKMTDLVGLLSRLPTEERKDFWVPTREQFEALERITQPRAREYEEKILYNEWMERRQEQNAATRTRNDTMKKARDEIIARGGNARQDMISTLMGAVLEDMSLDSQQRVKTWIRKDLNNPNYNPSMMANNLEDAYKMQDWMFIFEAAMAMHLQVIGDVDDCTLLWRQELQIEIFKKLKHEAGSLETWMRENLKIRLESAKP
jgi:hypothetical protein